MTQLVTLAHVSAGVKISKKFDISIGAKSNISIVLETLFHEYNRQRIRILLHKNVFSWYEKRYFARIISPIKKKTLVLGHTISNLLL